MGYAMKSLSVEHLQKRYSKVTALDDVSLDIQPGEIVGIVGPNGAGKTTLLKCILTLERPDFGRIRIFDHDPFTRPEKAKRDIAYVPETPDFLSGLTVQEYIHFIAAAFWTEEYKEETRELLIAFDLSEKRHSLQSELSKGQIMKTLIVAAFIHHPKLLFFDEPLLGIDPKGGKLLRQMILRTKEEGGSVVISSHMLDLIEDLSDRIIILNEGKIVASGTIDELRKQLSMEDSDFTDVFIEITEKAHEEKPEREHEEEHKDSV